MAGSTLTRGECVYCGLERTRTGMARHLQICPARLEVEAEADRGKRRKQTLYHLQVQSAWDGYYWLHLEMNGEAKLEALDHYLREIWLECCGHLSAFTIGPTRYTQIFDDGMGFPDERSMVVKVKTLFEHGMEIPYEYDFGSTSELRIKVVEHREGKPTTPHPIALMARNKYKPPPCIKCGQPAAYLCAECLYARDPGACEFCEEHALEHEHDEYLMPLLNSPRTGMCGYTGPAEPPY